MGVRVKFQRAWAGRATIRGMELRSVVIGAGATVLVAAGGFAALVVANAQDAPPVAPTPSVTVTVEPTVAPSATPVVVPPPVAPAPAVTPTAIPEAVVPAKPAPKPAPAVELPKPAPPGRNASPAPAATSMTEPAVTYTGPSMPAPDPMGINSSSVGGNAGSAQK